MLVLSRNPGEWIEVTHRSGDVLRIYLDSIQVRGPGHGDRRANLGFEDKARNFEIMRVRATPTIGFVSERPVPDPAPGDGQG